MTFRFVEDLFEKKKTYLFAIMLESQIFLTPSRISLAGLVMSSPSLTTRLSTFLSQLLLVLSTKSKGKGKGLDCTKYSEHSLQETLLFSRQGIRRQSLSQEYSRNSRDSLVQSPSRSSIQSEQVRRWVHDMTSRRALLGHLQLRRLLQHRDLVPRSCGKWQQCRTDPGAVLERRLYLKLKMNLGLS